MGKVYSILKAKFLAFANGYYIQVFRMDQFILVSQLFSESECPEPYI